MMSRTSKFRKKEDGRWDGKEIELCLGKMVYGQWTQLANVKIDLSMSIGWGKVVHVFEMVNLLEVVSARVECTILIE